MHSCRGSTGDCLLLRRPTQALQQLRWARPLQPLPLLLRLLVVLVPLKLRRSWVLCMGRGYRLPLLLLRWQWVHGPQTMLLLSDLEEWQVDRLTVSH